ncbi:HVA22 domain membrane protein [Rhizodiscina lignyota]|uniref:Protein YOP1 n=1 Tax=Rhizodiscina lignyota TaxID=1504668 RepID=A0A9P4IC90_9PEZI|nr:HVA22 domain membrane protein [Rhizodiscina lignyota]
MLDFIADLLTTTCTVLFPIFASYKALRTSDPSQLTPWLMYWVVLSLFTVAESYTAFILTYIPFYAWIRFCLHLYLVLPGKQGATQIYTTYVHPWLSQHEDEIEKFISEAHERARAAGMEYLKQAINWVKVNVLNQQPPPPSPPRPSSQTYAQQLLARFNMPSAGAPAAAAAGDLYGMLSGALAGFTGSGVSRDQAAEDLSASGTLIPKELEGKGAAEKMQYVSATRESLRVLLQAFDKEAFTLASGEGAQSGDLSKSRSEADFDNIDKDELAYGNVAEAGRGPQRSASGGWMPWNWAQKPEVEDDKKMQ